MLASQLLKTLSKIVSPIISMMKVAMTMRGNGLTNEPAVTIAKSPNNRLGSPSFPANSLRGSSDV